LLSLLVLPLMIPLLIFATAAVGAAQMQLPESWQLSQLPGHCPI
jgi:heme exporter protein CcmB